jgi:lauroyl/myristoyl acyltransferase
MIDSAPVLALTRTLAAALPRPAAHAIAAAGGLAAWALMPSIKLGPTTVMNYARTRADLFYRVEVRGPDDLPRDAVYVSGHVGNWELGGAWLARRFGLTVLAMEPTTAFSKFIDARRLAETIHTSGPCWKLRRLFRARGPVAALIDRPWGRIPRGPLALAWRRAVPIIPFWMVLARSGRYDFVTDPAIDATPLAGETRDAGTERLARELAGVLARMRARFADQWFAFFDGP